MKGSYEKPSITSINNGGDVNPTACTFFFAVLVLALAIAAGGGVVVLACCCCGSSLGCRLVFHKHFLLLIADRINV